MNIDESDITKIIVHYGVPEHFITLNDFIATSRGVEIVAQSLASKLFEEDVFVSVVILPPRDGSLKSRLGLICIGGILTFTIVNDDFVEGLTGVTPREVRLQAGQSARAGLEFLAHSTTRFLEKENSDLCELGIDETRFDKAYFGKDTFYTNCLKIENLSGVGFDDNEDLPISSSEFLNRIRNPEEGEPESFCQLHEVLIVSPNISRESKAKWRTKDTETGKTLCFNLEDLEFKNNLFNHKHSFTADDKMTVLVKYTKKNFCSYIGYEKRAIKVYRFNEIEFAPLPSDLEITRIMQDDDQDSDQLILF